MKLQRMALVLVVVFLVGCGKSEEKEESAACKRAWDTACQSWGKYLKALENGQPDIAGKGAKFAPEGYIELAAAATEALEAYEKATAEAVKQATKARFGKPGEDKLELSSAAFASAKTAREKAGAAIERAFAARLQKGADIIQRDKEAATPKKGVRLSAKRRKELKAKSAATQARVAKNNDKVALAKRRLLKKPDAILDLAKIAVENDEAAAAECAK